MDHSPAVLHERMKASLYFKDLTSGDGFFWFVFGFLGCFVLFFF